MSTDSLRNQLTKLLSQQLTPAQFCRQTVLRIKERSPKYDWVGIYLARQDALFVPDQYYVGPQTEHTTIPYDEGICGAAATQRKTIVVDDVNSDPRHIACSIHTQSEIVVPIQKEERLFGVLDLDSDQPAAFGEQERQDLEDAAGIIADYLDQQDSTFV